VLLLLACCATLTLGVDKVDIYSDGYDPQLSEGFRQIARSQVAFIQEASEDAETNQEQRNDIDLLNNLRVLIRGEKGAEGDRGLPGRAGPFGPAGPRGPKGPQGSNGPAGNTGIKGKLVGAQGVNGRTGQRGLLGRQGPAGATGPVGSMGRPGNPGEQGSQSKKAGKPGNQGPAGVSGYKGIPGKEGESGDQGPTGAHGGHGVQGGAGAAGSAGHHGMDGDAGNRGMRGVVGPPGNEGVTGPVGAPGPAGPNGRVGLHGLPGIAGPGGPVGQEGPTGSTGLTGPAGIEGKAGPSGDQGPLGPSGVRGSGGDAGPPGIRGFPGKDGKEGEPGPEGPEGKAGAAGLRGIPGGPGVHGTKGPVGSTYAYKVTGPDKFAVGFGGKDGLLMSSANGLQLAHTTVPCQIRFVQKAEKSGQKTDAGVIAGYFGNVGIGTRTPFLELHVKDECKTPNDSTCSDRDGQVMIESPDNRNVLMSKVQSAHYELIGHYPKWSLRDTDIYIGAVDEDAVPRTEAPLRIFFGGVAQGTTTPRVQLDVKTGKMHASLFEKAVSKERMTEIMSNADVLLDITNEQPQDISELLLSLHAKTSQHDEALSQIQKQTQELNDIISAM